MDKGNAAVRQNIRVFVRVRPSLPLESSSRTVLDCSSDKEITVKDNNKGKISDRQTKTFRFNQVFSPHSSQDSDFVLRKLQSILKNVTQDNICNLSEHSKRIFSVYKNLLCHNGAFFSYKRVEVYKHVVGPLLDEVLQGYSCTVFAYGQTGTGKTFTMEGEKSSDLSWGSDPNAGIIPRTLSELFDRLRLAEVNYAVRISFLELYNEELIDLLSAPDDTTKLRLYEDSTKKGAVIISGLEEVEVCTKADVYKILERGSVKRQTASTLMNAHSSRSHTVFTATLYIREQAEKLEGQDIFRTGKINLVDLAGSENIGRSGASDKRAREAGNINQSLLTLGRVITALVDGSPHIPYRESKLTRLLQESLGGRTKTSIIATVSPALCNYEETLSTLEYAHRAKNIMNKPEVNQRFSKKLHLTEYTEEIERLHRDLEATRQRTGVFLDHGEYEELLKRLDTLAEESIEKVEEIKSLHEERLKQEALCNELSQKIGVVDSDLQANEAALEAEKATLVELKSNVEKTRCEEREQTHLVAKHWETGQKLKAQVSVLKTAAEVSSKRGVLLHDKLDRVRTVTKTNENLGVEMQTEFAQKIESTVNLIDIAAKEDTDEISKLRTGINEVFSIQHEKLKELEHARRTFLDKIAQNVEESRTIVKQKAKQEVDCAVQFRDSVTKQAQSNLSVDSWLHDAAKPSLRKQREQVHDCSGEIADLLLKTVEEDVWSNDVRLAHADIVSRFCASLIEEQVPALNRELTKFEDVETIISELKKDHDEYRTKMRGRTAEVKKSLQAMQDMAEEWQATSSKRKEDLIKIVTKFSQGVASLKESSLDSASQGYSELSSVKDPFAQRAKTVCTQAFNVINQVDTSDQLGDLPVRTFEVIEEARAAWKAQNEETLRQIEKENLQRKGTIQSLNNCAQEARTLVEAHASENSETLDQIKLNFSALTDSVELRLSRFDDKVKTWISVMKEKATECRERVHRYFYEDFQQCAPAGDTPQRENLSYPRELATTSPHERILGRFREKMRLAKLSSEDEGSDSQTDSDSPPSMPAVDSSVEIDEGVRNKENSDTVRESPLKKSDKKKIKSRKPLVSQNGVR